MWSKACTLNRKAKSKYSISSSSFLGFITNQLDDLCPLGLLAQLVERCTSIVEVKGSNPSTSLNFFQPFFSQLRKLRVQQRRSYFIYFFKPAVPIYDFHIFIISKGKLIVIFIAFLADVSCWLSLLLFLLISGTGGGYIPNVYFMLLLLLCCCSRFLTVQCERKKDYVLLLFAKFEI